MPVPSNCSVVSMCGIAGFVTGRRGLEARISLRSMADTLRHRGPDDEGYLTMDRHGTIDMWGGRDTPSELQLPMLPAEPFPAEVGMAHRRLAILDLSPAGHQPMCTASGRHWIVFNGEIYNYLELRMQLERLGYTFRTASDTEVLLVGFEAWGAAVLNRVEGMFAFAVLDREARTLFLARDPFGIKPLYYAKIANDGFAFASEIKALIGLPGVSSVMHAPTVFEFLRYGVSDHGCETMFADIRQLPAAHSMTVRLDAPACVFSERYWMLPQRTPEFASLDDAARVFRGVLEYSVGTHMRSDVSVGACLSGGLDSTAIVALSAPMMPPDVLFRTVSFISPDPLQSEAPFVELAKEAIPIQSETVFLTAADVAKDIEQLVWSQDVPFGSLSIYAQYGVFRRAKASGLTVMLDGQGSDELLGGYNAAVSAAIAERIAAGHVGRALTLARAFSPLGTRAYSRTLLSAVGRFVPPGMAPWFMRAVGEPVMPQWIDGRWFNDRQIQPIIRPQGRGRQALDAELRLFTETLTLPHLLRYEDRNSMAFSIESRVPFCNTRVAEVISRASSDMLVTDMGETKAILRVAMRDLVPEAIINRPKVGFAAPDREWLSALQPMWQRILREEAGRLPFLRRDIFANTLRHELAANGYYSHHLWRMLSTILWARVFDVHV